MLSAASTRHISTAPVVGSRGGKPTVRAVPWDACRQATWAATAALVAAAARPRHSLGFAGRFSASWRALRRRAACGAQGELGLAYDAKVLEDYFAWRPLAVVWRLLVFLSVALQTGVGAVADQVMLGSEQPEELQRRAAVRLKELLISLGPTFVKLGQSLSVRPDVLNEIFLAEFQEFQDGVAPFDHDEAVRLVLRGLGIRDLSERFRTFASKPVAAASLGQVYKAELLDGSRVAVKVQRPNLAETVSLDLVIARQIAKFLMSFNDFLPEGLQNSDLIGFVDAFGQRVFEELDYEMEVKNAQRFRELYGDQAKLKVPRMYSKLATRQVIVMEWIDGVKLTDVEAISGLGLDPLTFITIGIECSMRQLLEHGFFHADPHPGNFFVTKQGELCILDFGMMSEMPKDARLSVIQHIVHIVNRDYRGMAADYHELGFLSRDIDVRPIAPKLEAFFEPRLAPARVAAISFKTIVDGLTEVVFQNYPFTVPAFYALVVRSLVNLEGLALSIDEDYRVLEAAYPYVARRILLDSELRSSLMELLFSSLPSTGPATFASFRWDRAANLLRESSKSSISVPGRKTADGRSDDTVLLLDLASSLIEEEAFRRTLLAELASTADVMIADMIGGAVAGITGDEPASAEWKRTLGLGSEDEAKVSKVKETVNLIAEKVADRIPNGLDAVGWAAQAAAGALQDIWAPGESTSQPKKKGPAPSPDAMAGEFLEQLRERAAVRTLKALANLLGSEDDGRSAGGGPQQGRGVTR